MILCAKRFETPTWQEPIKQGRNSGQLFRPSWDSSECAEKICNASQGANAHKLQNKMTRSFHKIPYFELTCVPKHALPHHVFQGARWQSVTIEADRSIEVSPAVSRQKMQVSRTGFENFHYCTPTQKLGSRIPSITRSSVVVKKLFGGLDTLLCL